ncbi:autotransporter assembly complex protein TamA [Kordiimonas pumila]|uniref:Autotransporter assembly complex family protein n=1 Tax=Kordiimonas pumila TaxID=2161677 RepID=A0ABV7D8Y2_9PROT|nr:autotransporter assembly complex family protein [Kordiimonas pumila]
MTEPNERLRDILMSVSVLNEKTGQCLRSIARVESNLQSDVDSFQRVLRSEGYYAASVDYKALRGDKSVDVSVAVYAGVLYKIDSVSFSFAGAEKGDTENIQLEAVLKKGEPASAADIVATEQVLIFGLLEQGYPFAEAGERSVTVNHATASVAVNYVLQNGPKTKLGETIYEGLDRTEASYLERLKPWQEGDLYTRSEVDEFRSRLMATGLFRLTTVTLQQPNEGTDIAPIVVNAEEAPPRRIEAGAGYSTGEGFELETSWTHRNTWGRGENLKFSMKLGESEQTLEADLRKPQFKRYGQTAIFNARTGRESTPAYKSHIFESYAGLERQIGKRWIGSLGVSGKATQVREDGEHDEYVLLGTPLGLSYDTSDVLLDPTRGIRLNLRLGPNMSLIGDRFFFLTSELKGSAYWQPDFMSSVTFAVRGRAGMTFGPDQDRIPLTERFFAGGGGSVRGYSYQGIGPQDEDGDPLGGRSVLEVGFEARVRVSTSISIVPFLDGGALYTDQIPTFNGFRWGTGLGLRYHTSIAPVRLDVAFPLDRREGDSAVAVYLSIGQSF